MWCATSWKCHDRDEKKKIINNHTQLLFVSHFVSWNTRSKHRTSQEHGGENYYYCYFIVEKGLFYFVCVSLFIEQQWRAFFFSLDFSLFFFFFNIFFAALSHSNFGHVRFIFTPYSTFSIVQCRTTVWRTRIHRACHKIVNFKLYMWFFHRKGKFRLMQFFSKWNLCCCCCFFFVPGQCFMHTDIGCALRAYRKTVLFKRRKKKQRWQNLLHFLTNDHFSLNFVSQSVLIKTPVTPEISLGTFNTIQLMKLCIDAHSCNHQKFG